jgi:hypothetical protein
MACLAVGQFFSSLTQNQIIAALITVPVLLGFWFVGHLQTFQTDYILRELFGYLSFSLHFGDLSAVSCAAKPWCSTWLSAPSL